MSVSVKVQTRIIVTRNDGQEQSFLKTHSFTGLTEVETREFSISTASTQTVWDPLAELSELAGTFAFLAILSDGNVEAEFICDDGGEVGKNVWTHRVAQDTPFVLGGDDSYANPGADDATSGTLDVIER